MGITRRIVTVLVLLVIASAAVTGCGSSDDGSIPVITDIDVEGSNNPPKPIKHRDPETVRGIVDNCRVTVVYAIYLGSKTPGTREGPFFCDEYEADPVFAHETIAPFGSKRCTKQVESVEPEEAYSSPTIGDIWIALSRSKRCKRIHFVYVLR